MKSRAITPRDLTFESFRHSQGAFSAQVGILGYAYLAEGVEPLLELSPDEINRYYKYINDPNSKRHINDLDEQDALDNVINATFRNLKYSIENDKSFEHYLQTSDFAYGIGRLLLETEMRILGEQDTRKDEISGVGITKREARLAQRVANGRASFLHFYGRDGNPTGYSVFDKMYAEIWNEMNGTRIDPDLIERHTTAVQRAQERFLKPQTIRK